MNFDKLGNGMNATSKKGRRSSNVREVDRRFFCKRYSNFQFSHPVLFFIKLLVHQICSL